MILFHYSDYFVCGCYAGADGGERWEERREMGKQTGEARKEKYSWGWSKQTGWVTELCQIQHAEISTVSTLRCTVYLLTFIMKGFKGRCCLLVVISRLSFCGGFSNGLHHEDTWTLHQTTKEMILVFIGAHLNNNFICMRLDESYRFKWSINHLLFIF